MALLAMAKPGQYLFQVTTSSLTGCKLARVNL
jgi:hypothetical protein